MAAVIVLAPAMASAQIPGFDDHTKCRVRSVNADHFTCTGDVVLEQPGMKLYADQVDFYPKTNRLIATGNVLLRETDHQIAADRADFDAVTQLGTFYNASGYAALGKMADVSQFGTLQPDVQFYGETIEKTGPQTYLISHGGFTTCTQATPRWKMTSGSIKLRVDHYALLRNMFLKAKGVPVLFLPVLYYPISSDARQTGFLMPSYGSSSYRGQVVSNGFFWAIGRSQDATVLHDWYSKTGQGISGE
jgi:LPS-assembly protein